MATTFETTNARRGVYRPELDGLRFFAFLAVFCHHALPDTVRGFTELGVSTALAPWLSTAVLAGSLGVDFFLCLSAYLITELLVRERDERGHIDYRAFLVRRALRIWPLYYAFLGFVVFVWPLFAPDERMSLRQAVTFATFLSNWECAFHGYPTSLIAPLWSIALEEQFYVLFPFVMLIASMRRRIALLAALIVVAMIARYTVFLLVHEASSQMLWCNTFTRLDPIAMGALLALVARGRAPRWHGGLRIAAKVLALGLVLVTAYVVPLHRDPIGRGAVLSFTMMAAACTLIVWSTLRAHDDVRGMLARPVLVYLGRISYGLYVFHMVGQRSARAILEALAPDTTSLPVFVLLALTITIGLAALCYALLEKPFLRLKTRFIRVATSDPPVTSDDDETVSRSPRCHTP
jgi:peptidoglycan/LPS O-acetylase OafA/YrhL